MYRTRTITSVFVGLFVFVVSAAFSVSANSSVRTTAPLAQPRVTIQARATEAAAQAGQVQAQLTAAAATVQAGLRQGQAAATEVAVTVQAASTEINQGVANVQATVTAIAATAQYLATTVNQSADAAQATVTAISATIEAWTTALPEAVQALLPYLSAQGSVVYDANNNQLIVTGLITEEQSNILIDVVVEAAGYNPDNANLDYTADGLVIISLTDVSGELPGTITLIYRLTIVDGRIVPVAESISYNGRELPQDQLPAELLNALQVGVNAAALQNVITWPGAPFSYTVMAAHVSANSLTLIYHIPLYQF